MGGFRRFCLIVFGLAGALCLAALALPWIGPYQDEATRLMDNWYYYIALQSVLAITAAGVIVALLRGVFTPRRRKTVTVGKEGADLITVTTAAISSQATHVIEDGDRFVAEKVRVAANRRGSVSVNVRVRPRRVVDIVEEGRRLHDELVRGLSVICGDRVRTVNLEFVEAELGEPAQDVVVEQLEVPQSVIERAERQAAGPAEDRSIEPAEEQGRAIEPAEITVPISSLGSTSSDTSDDEHPYTEGEVEER